MGSQFLDSKQRQHAVSVMREYLDAPPGPDGRVPTDKAAELDSNRRSLIAGQLGPLVRGYLAGEIALAEFKSQVDGINKRHEHWGFKGIKGQMFFNMVVNTAPDLAECDQELKAALAVPANEEMAKSRIRTFAS